MPFAIVANGTPRSVQASLSVAGFLCEMRLDPDRVVVEYNGEPLGRDLFATTPLREGDRLEIAQMVGGG